MSKNKGAESYRGLHDDCPIDVPHSHVAAYHDPTVAWIREAEAETPQPMAGGLEAMFRAQNALTDLKPGEPS